MDHCIELARGDYYAFDGARVAAVRIADGEVWLTRDGDIDDHFLGAGRVMPLGGRGTVCVGARAATRVVLETAG